MSIEVREILDLFRDNIGKIMIALGVFFIFIAVPLLSRAYQWVSFSCFLSGVILIIVGTALHFESFKWKVPSVGGFGTIFIYVSLVFVATALVTAFFSVLKGFDITPMYGTTTTAVDEHGSPFMWISRSEHDNIINIWLERPNAWLATPLLLIGLGLLALGFLLKFASDAL